MTDGIGRIFGGNSYGVGGYYQQQPNDKTQAEEPQVLQANNYEETQVDPSKVMEFLANNNYFVAPTENKPVTEVDPETADRIGGYMENFEMIYGLIVEEFGEELAPMVMDMVMDKLIGQMAA